MSYTMMAADKIFDGSRFLENKVLVISGEGRIEEIIPVSDAGEEVSFHQGILCPGLINCHCHLELSHMKGLIGEQTGLVDFVCRVVAERQHPEAEMRKAMEDAENQTI